MSRSRQEALSDEDRILWSLVARSATPLKGRKPVEPPPAEAHSTQDAIAQRRTPESLVAATTPPAPKKQIVQTLFDRPTHDKVAAGRLPIEGRVDLHGMTQDEAYGLLLSFLGRAHAGGVRYVLVITGKGSSTGGDGVLRRVVPAWLATAPFRALVSSHDDAARHHGGGGAIYIRLRKSPPRR